jgi:hypothetical protein
MHRQKEAQAVHKFNRQALFGPSLVRRTHTHIEPKIQEDSNSNVFSSSQFIQATGVPLYAAIMQAVSGVLTSGPACLAACKHPTQAWKRQATTVLGQSAMRPVGIFTVKSFAGRQLRAEQWMSAIAQRRRGAFGVEAKAVPVLSPVGQCYC